jgi:VWFA-related protein
MPIQFPPPLILRARGSCQWLLVALLVILLAPAAHSQAQTQTVESAQPPAPVQQTAQPPAVRPRRVTPTDVLPADKDETYHVDTDLVLLDATVTDAEGRPVRNLQAKDFKLYEDGVERPLAFFNVEQRSGMKRPVAVVFALDVSGSMTSQEMARLGSAMRAFSERLMDRTSVFALMTFGMRVHVLQNFTGDPHKLNHALDRLAREESGLSTHAYDAVDDAIRLLARDAPRTRAQQLLKRAVVVVTDGFPVGDTVAPATVIERANAADVSVYTVTLPSFSRLFSSSESAHAPLPTPLDVSGLVEKTGGTNVYATDKDYEPLFHSLAEEVTSSYVLAFYPPEAQRHDGRYHNVRIEAPDGLVVRQSRPGYQSGK